MKRLTLLSVSIVLLTNLIYSQSVDVKDGSANTLIQINDEGTTGSITFPSGGTPDPVTNKLYNEGGVLKWKGNSLGLAGGSDSDWLIDGNDLKSLVSGSVLIGGTTSSTKLFVGTTNLSEAISGSNHLTNGTGVNGFAANEIGTNYGGYFSSRGNTGYGVFGKASNTGSGVHYGGYFHANGSEGHGVYGYVPHPSSENFAVRGKTLSQNGWAGYFEGRGYFSNNVGIGNSNPQAKLSVGGDGYSYAAIYGKMDGGSGVYGDAIGSVSYGVFGKTSGSGGYGVYGLANHPSGTNFGVYGKTMSGSGWAGYFDGRGYFSSKVGIGTTTPQATLHVKDLVMIEPGKQPTSSQEGMIYYDGTTHKLRVYNGTAWINLH